MKKASEIEAQLIAGGAPKALAKSFAAEQVAEGLAEDDSQVDITDEPEFKAVLHALKKAKSSKDEDEDDEDDESYSYDDEDDDDDDDESPGEGADFTPGRRMKSGGASDMTMEVDGDRVVGVLARGADKIVKSFTKTTDGLAVAGTYQVNTLRKLQKSLAQVQQTQEVILNALRVPMAARAITGTVTAQEHPGVAETRRVQKSSSGEPLVHKLTAAIRTETAKLSKSMNPDAANRLHNLASISSQLDSGMNDDDTVRQLAAMAGIEL